MGSVQLDVPRGGAHPLSLKLKVGNPIKAREEITPFMTTKCLMPRRGDLFLRFWDMECRDNDR